MASRPTREEAESLLLWAEQQNPGPWVSHSRNVARAAEAIAAKCNLDSDKAYISGLLHDVGRYEGVSGMHHIYSGYELLTKKGYSSLAEICLTHSFPYQSINEYFGDNDCSPTETEIIIGFLKSKKYNDYDRLIQLCDAIASAEGICLLEVRVMDVIRRYGTTPLTKEKIEASFALKKYFDSLCGINIYDLFYDEIRDVSFR